MDPPVQVAQLRLQVSSIFFPCHPIHSRCSPLLQAVITFPEQIGGYMVQQGGKPYFPVSLDCCSHTVQPAWPVFPTRCSAWVRLSHVLLGQPPFPPQPPPTVARFCSAASQVLRGCTTPRYRACGTYMRSLSP